MDDKVSGILEMIATGEPLSETLSRLCILVETSCPSCASCSILLLDPETKTLWHAASPNVPKAYTESIDGFAIGPDVSSCGTAAHHQKQVIADDISTDPRWAAFRDLAINNGLRACWSTPIFSQKNSVLGTFAMFSSEPGSPTVDDQKLIAQITHLASIAIERHRAHQSLTNAIDELKQSESRLQTIINTIPTIVWRARPDGSGEFWNKRWHDYTGLSQESAQSQGWEAIIHPEDIGRVASAYQTSLVTGQPGQVEGRQRRADGQYHWFQFRYEPFRDTSGDIINWYGANSDIDDTKRAESLLAAEKRLLEMVATGHSMPQLLKALCQLVEETSVGCYCSIVLVDQSGMRLENGAAPSLPESFVTSVVGRPVNAESGPCAMSAYLKEQIIAADIETETRWAAYEWCPMALAHGLRSCWSTPILSTAGVTLGAFAIYYSEPRAPMPDDQALIARFTHIASIAIERKRSEERLYRSEACLIEAQRLSLTGSFGWIVSVDEHFWSEETFRIFEYDTSTKVSIQLVLDRAIPEDVPLIEKAVAVSAEGQDFDYECRFLMPSGKLKHLHIVAHATRCPDGQLEYIGAVQDVTARRHSDEALGKARSELAHVARVSSLGALTASIAHEVNQPLSGIITNASACLRLLATDPPDIAGARETAHRTIRDGNRASDVITRLRALFIKKSVTTESLDLNEATQEVVAISLSELRRSRVILQSEFADKLPPVCGDRVQLQQVILNLLRNASDAMNGVDDRPRRLMIRTERDGGEHVRLTVQDSGVGVDPQNVDRLFDAFYSTKSDGMGIGLSVSRSIIESHHGRLWAAANDGPGASFSFSIPLGTRSVASTQRARRSTATTDVQHDIRN
jgi:PAS domain S-box-containing protein